MTPSEEFAASIGGMRLLLHALLIAVAFAGTDYWLNRGAETRALAIRMENASLRQMWNVQAYHVREAVKRDVATTLR